MPSVMPKQTIFHLLAVGSAVGWLEFALSLWGLALGLREIFSPNMLVSATLNARVTLGMAGQDPVSKWGTIKNWKDSHLVVELFHLMVKKHWHIFEFHSFILLRRENHWALRPASPPAPVRYLGKGPGTSQAGFSNLNIINIMRSFLANNDKMWYTCLILSSLI